MQVVLVPYFFTLAAFDAESDSLYGMALSDLENPFIRAKLVRVDLRTRDVSILKYPDDLFARAIALNRGGGTILISGSRPVNGTNRRAYGIFEIQASTGAVARTVIQSGCADQRQLWHQLHASKDGQAVLATNGNQLNLIDLKTGESRAIPGFSAGAWSPDGTWIAALRHNAALALLDPLTLEVKKELGNNSFPDVLWSPDSHRLIGTISGHGCPTSWTSLETIDVATGQREPLKGAKCQVRTGEVGWLDPAGIPEPIPQSR